MSDFLSRVEAILSGVMNFNPKSRVERLLMKLVGSVGNVEDLETEDKSSVVAAINEVNSSGGGDIPSEVSNAIETHGMGWTSEKEVEGFDIQWDGNTTGLESFFDQAYKVASSVEGIDAESVVGATMVFAGYSIEVTEDIVIPSGDNVLMIQNEDPGGTVVVVSEDSTLMDAPITKGVWFFKSTTDENEYVSRLYKEASTEEVVHQIDQKYIPQGSDDAFVIDYSNPRVDDYTNAVVNFNNHVEVKLQKGATQIPMIGYDANHCVFGGTVSAYLPGGYVIAVYAHIGPNGENYFWYQYNSPVEAAGLYCEDAGGYFESNNVMGQLQEIGARLASLSS